MKVIQALFICLLSLALMTTGCGDQSSDPVNPIVSIQELPADDDIQGLYSMEIPHNWETTEDPVLYAKYFRAKLLRQFGNKPEVHIVADMELKKRQGISTTSDEDAAYLDARYRLFSNVR